MPPDVILSALISDLPREVLWGIFVLYLGVSLFKTYRDEILPARKVYQNEKKRLELLKLWYEVRALAGNDLVVGPPAHLIEPLPPRVRTSMVDPFAWISPQRRSRFLLISFTVTVLFSVAMSVISMPLSTAAAPYGMVSLEFARNALAAEAILQSWSPDLIPRAILVTALDFLFILAYITAFGLACSWVADRLQPYSRFWSNLGLVSRSGIIAAGVLDAVENVALLQVLFGNVSPFWIRISFLSASIKFVLISIALIYMIFGFAFIMMRKVAARPA